MDYPEALVEKVAISIFEWDIEEHDDPKPVWATLREPQRNVWRSGAVAALDAIGLQEDRRTVVLAGNDTPVKAKPGKWLRYTTRWEPIRD